MYMQARQLRMIYITNEPMEDTTLIDQFNGKVFTNVYHIEAILKGLNSLSCMTDCSHHDMNVDYYKAQRDKAAPIQTDRKSVV